MEIIYGFFSSSFLLTILFISIILGFSLTIFVLHIFDGRVYDTNGKFIPSPSNYLWDLNFVSMLIRSLRSKRPSYILSEEFLNNIGDGNIVAFNTILDRPSLIIANPDLIKSILTGHHLKFPKVRNSDRILKSIGVGLNSSNGHSWSNARNALNPYFQSDSLRTMISIFNLHSKKLSKHWIDSIFNSTKVFRESNNIRVELSKDITQVTRGIICHSALGFDYQIRPDGIDISDDLETIMSEINLRIMDPFEWWYLLFPERRYLFNESLKNFRKFIDNVIDERLDFLAKQPQTPNSDLKSPSRKRPNDFLEILLSSLYQNDKNPFSKKEINNFLLDFIISGHETISSIVLWVIFELSLHPEIQLKCQEEIDSIMNPTNGKTKKSVNFDDINKFNYLTQVIRETLRLHPPQCMIHRKCSSDCSIGEFQIRAGSRISLDILALHQHPDYWFNPYDFIPERFSKEFLSDTLKHPYQFIPFSAGPRACIGQKFAMMECVVILSLLLSRFSFSISIIDKENLQLEEGFTNLIKNFHCTIALRN